MEGSRPEAPLAVGSMLDRYMVLEPLGRGGMGVVYAAFDAELDRRVAIKVVRGRRRGNSERRLRLLREAQAMARLNHPNVITVHHVGEHGRRVYLVMEIVRGPTLRTWLLERRRPWREVMDRFLAAAAGLSAAHAAGVVHRDFKPANVLITDDDRVLVTDFGLARVLESGSSSPSMPSDSSTETSRPALGTPAYMAPEQHDGGEVGPAADQYSFCVALYEALYGVRPATRDGEFPGRRPPRDKTLPPRVYAVLRRGLSSSAAERYPSMRALSDALRDATRPRPLRRAAALVGILACSLGYALPESSDCDGARVEWNATWNPQVRDRVTASFVHSGALFADDSAQRAARSLDILTDQWLAARRDICESLDEGEVSQRIADHRRACLHRIHERADALLASFEDPDAATVEHAPAAAARLGSVERCRSLGPGDLESPAAPVSSRVDAVANLRRQIERGNELLESGLLSRAMLIADAAVATAHNLDHPPAIAEALLLQGRMLAAHGRELEASDRLAEAYWQALSAHHDTVAHHAAIRLVSLLSRSNHRDQAQRWARHAQAARDRIGS